MREGYKYGTMVNADKPYRTTELSQGMEPMMRLGFLMGARNKFENPIKMEDFDPRVRPVIKALGAFVDAQGKEIMREIRNVREDPFNKKYLEQIKNAK